MFVNDFAYYIGVINVSTLCKSKVRNDSNSRVKQILESFNEFTMNIIKSHRKIHFFFFNNNNLNFFITH